MRRGDLAREDQLKAVMDSVMERGRTIQRAPDLVRARLLARARSTIATANLASAPMPIPTAQPVASSRSRRLSRSVLARESYSAELELLQRAQSQYASHNFSDALVLIAEHARRFPNGRLAEEREALRVRSLAGAGRAEEKRRAFTAFAKRFPRSALLPRLRETVPAAEE